jgi:hypothetical protein
MPRSDYDNCSSKIGCACQKCQYFWEIRDGSVVWSKVLASRFISTPGPTSASLHFSTPKMS